MDKNQDDVVAKKVSLITSKEKIQAQKQSLNNNGNSMSKTDGSRIILNSLSSQRSLFESVDSRRQLLESVTEKEEGDDSD